MKAPELLEWIADGGDSHALGDREQRTCDRGEDVGVLVGVEMCDVDAGGSQPMDLRGSFASDVGRADFTAKNSEMEARERWAEVFAIRTEERGNCLWRRDRSAVGKDDVATDS